MNWLLIAANVGMFAVQSFMHPAALQGLLLNSRSPELHQFVSYAFLHGGASHLISNMLFLYIFGNNICDRLGNWAYLAFYLAGAVFAAVGYVPFHNSMMLGASGAVSAVTGAYLALMPRSHITVLYIFILIGFAEIPSLWFVLVFFVQDVFLNFAGNTGTAHLAHISGSIFGFLVCMLMLKARLLPRDHFDMLALIDRWNRRRQYQSVVRNGYDPFNYAPRPPADRSPANAHFDQIQNLRAEISEAIAHGQLDHATGLYQQLRQIDTNQVLSRTAQLDIANRLYALGQYPAAAEAYELYLKIYGTGEFGGQVHLMLGLAYGRYLNQPQKARVSLEQALRLVQSQREMDLARSELQRLSPI